MSLSHPVSKKTTSHPDLSWLVSLGPGPGPGPGFPPHRNRFARLDLEDTTDDEAAAAAAAAGSRSGRPGRVFNEITRAVEDDAESTSCPPDLVLINQTGRISDRRNATTAECRTGKGQAVAVSFWFVEPPDVSYFSVHCPGLQEDDFSDTPPLVLCAEGPFFLFCVTLNVPEWSSVHHFVYSARGIPGGRPSLHLLPDPKPRVEAFMSQQFGLLPCGDEHYAVAFLHHEWDSGDKAWHYYAYIFSSETKAWRRSDEALLRLSNSDQLLFDRHASSKQITVGESSLGLVDLLRGVLLLSNLFDQRPVITYIQLPAEKACITDKDGYTYHAPEYSRDITCCGDLIKFVEVEFDEPYCRTNGQGWRATTWSRKVSSDDWGRRHTVGVAEISVEPSCSSLLPELLNDETNQLEIKKLIFLIPTLSTNDDDLLYMMGKVNEEDDTAWVITVDMKRAALEALVPIATKPSHSVTTYCPCAFPYYYFDITPGPGMANPMGMHFERLSVAQFVMQVQRAREWFRELGLLLDCELSTYKESIPLLIECCPVSSVSSNIRALLKYATCTDETSNAIKLLLRAFEDFDLLLTESLHEQASVEILRSKITVALPVLDNLLQIMLPTVMPEGRDQGGVGIFEQYEKPGYTKDYQSGGSTAEKPLLRKMRRRRKKRRQQQQQETFKSNNFLGNVASNRWLWYLGGCMLISISMLALSWMVLIT